MRRFVTLNYYCMVDKADGESFPSDAIQNLRRTLLAPIVYKPILLEALQNVNFKFHRTCSFSNIIRNCNACDGETLLMFWGHERSESRLTMSASSCSSAITLASPTNGQRERELRNTAQQTDISCRSPDISSPASPREAASPAPSLLPPAARSTSILGSVCALLLNKQQNSRTSKELSSLSDSARSLQPKRSVQSDAICRICFGGSSSAVLVRPCGCRGTVAAVHRACLERWLLHAATSYCELCRHHYVVTRTHKWSFLRSVAEWARSGRARALAADAARGAALGAASVLGTARALHACDVALRVGALRGGAVALAANLFSSVLIGIIGALNGLLTTWMLLKIQEHQASWQAWRDSTLHVHVVLGGEGTDTGAGAGTEAGATADRATNIADPFMVGAPEP